MYTLNHYEYVSLFHIFMLEVLLGVLFYEALLKTNLKMSVSNANSKCCFYFIDTFLSLIRFTVGTFLLYIISSDLLILIIKTVTITHYNNWQEKDEPFLTNCSKYTALCCWILWFIMYTGMLSVVIIIRDDYSCQICKMLK